MYKYKFMKYNEKVGFHNTDLHWQPFNFQIYSDLDIEYFEGALDWVLARDEVCGQNGVGLSGVSQVIYVHVWQTEQIMGPKCLKKAPGGVRNRGPYGANFAA